MSLISDNITLNIKPSPTLLVETKANELRAQGLPVISLGAGEPDFDTPQHIKDAGIEAINKGFTKYTPVGGLKDLKEAVIQKFKQENGLEYKLDQILVSSGAKQVIYNALMATLNSGDEVIIVAPYWVSYPDMVKIAGGKPIIISSDPNKNFAFPIEEFKEAINPKTKWLIINSPSNPCGVVYSKSELEQIAKVVLETPNLYVMSDDIYEHLVYDNEQFYTIAQTEPKIKDRVLTINGVSKTYAMTGWRIGYCAGPAELIKAMVTVQSQSTSNPCSISQKATVVALTGPQDFLQTNNDIFKARRDFVCATMNQINRLSCESAKGAFYLFIDCRQLFGTKSTNGKVINNSYDLAEYFLESCYVAVVAGAAFGMEGFFRVSYATSLENLQEACKRIHAACDKLI